MTMVLCRTKDETKELFSDSECEERQSSEGKTGEEEIDKENADAGEEDGEDHESKATPHSPLYSTPGAKRPNPFKVHVTHLLISTCFGSDMPQVRQLPIWYPGAVFNGILGQFSMVSWGSFRWYPEAVSDGILNKV